MGGTLTVIIGTLGTLSTLSTLSTLGTLRTLGSSGCGTNATVELEPALLDTTSPEPRQPVH